MDVILPLNYSLNYSVLLDYYSIRSACVQDRAAPFQGCTAEASLQELEYSRMSHHQNDRTTCVERKNQNIKIGRIGFVLGALVSYVS